MSFVSSNAIVQVTNTVNTVMIAMDQGDGALFASQYASDGSCTIEILNKTFNGHSELSNLCMTLHDKFVHCMHWEGNVSVSKGSNEGGKG